MFEFKMVCELVELVAISALTSKHACQGAYVSELLDKGRAGSGTIGHVTTLAPRMGSVTSFSTQVTFM